MQKVIKFPRECNRCHLISHYAYLTTADDARDNLDCRFCGGIPDETLYLFIKEKIHARICPTCKEVIKYQNKLRLLATFRLNLDCKTCSNRKNNRNRYIAGRRLWSNVVGNTNITTRKLYKIKKYWSSISPEERTNILLKTKKQKQYFWGHLSRTNEKLRLIRLKKSFEKYRGENHWMKDPKVLAKIKHSCKKYRGDNHWFRRNKKS
jgi:hypothetical protein